MLNFLYYMFYALIAMLCIFLMVIALPFYIFILILTCMWIFAIAYIIINLLD